MNINIPCPYPVRTLRQNKWVSGLGFILLGLLGLQTSALMPLATIASWRDYHSPITDWFNDLVGPIQDSEPYRVSWTFLDLKRFHIMMHKRCQGYRLAQHIREYEPPSRALHSQPASKEATFRSCQGMYIVLCMRIHIHSIYRYSYTNTYAGQSSSNDITSQMYSGLSTHYQPK